MNVVSTASGAHYTWGNQCDGWHLVRSDALSVIQERMPPATSEIRHCHARALQFFYVLAGELSVALPGQTHTLRAEQGLEVAPGVPHRVFNDSAVEARFLVISYPPAQGDRVTCPEEPGGS